MIPIPGKPLSIAVLFSGGGTTLANLAARIADGSLSARIVTTIASRPGIAGIGRAAEAGTPCRIISPREFPDVPAFSRAVFDECRSARAELVCLAGWLSMLEIPADFHWRVMNIHPALLPSFGGRGMYGQRVHQAVLSHGCKVSGCTVHFVDATYDTGPIIVQRTCPVAEDDTPESLAHRVFEEEKLAYPEAIRLFAAGRLSVVGRRVRIKACRG